jgi:hypothetical protein
MALSKAQMILSHFGSPVAASKKTVVVRFAAAAGLSRHMAA